MLPFVLCGFLRILIYSSRVPDVKLAKGSWAARFRAAAALWRSRSIQAAHDFDARTAIP
jgi:hypothetical protein